MKKIYMQPSTKNVHLTVVKMIAVSNRGVTFTESGSGEIQTQDGDAVSAGMSRQSLWDDEEDDY